MKFLIGLATGALFGIGLVVAGMTDSARIFGFLDVFGEWDPRLMFVMVGAIGVHAPFVYWLKRRGTPYLANSLTLPAQARIDVALVSGAALFGIGWGLGGFCPGPAVVASLRNGNAALVAVAMIAGMWLADYFTEPKHFAMKPSRPFKET